MRIKQERELRGVGMDLISIIVPVYNAEATIGRCVESLLAQTYPNIEYIFVNDGSADRSGFLLDEISKKDNRVHVIHTENRGVSAARNAGIEQAKGDYIGFADADDWVDATMYQHLAELIEREKADMSICGYYLEYPDKKAENTAPHHSDCRVLSASEVYAAVLEPDGFRGYLFNKLFKSAFFQQTGDNIRMDESLHICEDLLCVCRIISRINIAVYDTAPYYHYVVSANSASNTSFTLRKATLIDARRKISDLTRQFFPSLIRYAQSQYMTDAAYIFLLSMHANSDWRLAREDMRRVRKLLFSYIFSRKKLVQYKLLLIGISVSQSAVKAIWGLFRGKKALSKSGNE